MGLFRRSAAPELGIDIGSGAVKLLELSRRNGHLRIESYAVQPLPAHAVVEQNIVDMEAVAAAVQVALRRSGTRARRVATAVPTAASISKRIALPADLSADELEAQIELQAEQHVPYPAEEVSLDYQVLGPGRQEEEIEVLLVASRRAHLAARVGALEAAGLIPRVVDIEAYAMESAGALACRLLPANAKLVALIDIGAGMTSFTVLRQGRSAYAREQVFGGRMLTEELMRRYGLSAEAADRAQRTAELPAGSEDELLAPFKDAIAQQAARSLQLWLSSGQRANVEHILLTGGCATIPGLCEQLQAHTGIATTIANPFGAMTLAPAVQPHRLAQDAPALMVACGLALRSFD